MYVCERNIQCILWQSLRSTLFWRSLEPSGTRKEEMHNDDNIDLRILEKQRKRVRPLKTLDCFLLLVCTRWEAGLSGCVQWERAHCNYPKPVLWGPRVGHIFGMRTVPASRFSLFVYKTSASRTPSQDRVKKQKRKYGSTSSKVRVPGYLNLPSELALYKASAYTSIVVPYGCHMPVIWMAYRCHLDAIGMSCGCFI